TLNFTVADPVDPDAPSDVEAARSEDGLFNRIFLDPIFTGAYPPDVVEEVAHLGLMDHVQPGDLELVSAPSDLLRVNYYSGSAASAPPAAEAPDGHNRPDGARQDEHGPAREVSSPHPVGGVHHHTRGLPTTAMGWEVQPEGLNRLLQR